MVLANGEILHTGSGAHRHSNPFYRHFGPDLTGIFTADPRAFRNQDQDHAQADRRARGDSQRLLRFRDDRGNARRPNSACAQANCVGVQWIRSLLQRSDEGSGLQLRAHQAGSAKPGQIKFTLHVSIDAIDKASAEGALAIVRDCCTSDGVELDSAIPAAFKAQPFGGVRTILLGAEGELWLPVHGFFPLSKTKAAARATERFFADNTDLLRRHGIKTSYLTCFSGSEFVIEPSFYWFDELGKFRLDLIEPEYREKWKTIKADREAREVVLRLREELRDLFFQHGACSVQIARFYPYRDAMNNPHTWRLLEELNRLLDPKGLMNPGALGLR